MSPWLYFLYAGFHLCVGVGIGWFARGYRNGPVAGPAAKSREASPPLESIEGSQLLENLGDAIDEHSRCIGAFEVSLRKVPDSSDTAEFAETFYEAKAAGHQFHQTFEELIPQLERLTPRQRWHFGDLLAQFEAHCENSRHLHGLLEKCDEPAHAVRERDVMLAVIAGLLESKRNLESELQSVRKRLQDQNQKLTAAERAARHDVLTDLPNRRAFEERIAQLQAEFQRCGEPYACILVDIDHFKGLNDSLGHAAGDTALAVLGRVLSEVIRASDHPARFGGEEFAVLLPNTRVDDAMLVAERCRTRITETTVQHQGQSFGFTVSAGVAEIRPGESSEDLLHRTDAALYAAKRAGRNCVQIDLSHEEGPEAQANSELASVG